MPVPYGKSATDQAIRVVNAFRSGLDTRNNPSQSALTKRTSTVGLSSSTKCTSPASGESGSFASSGSTEKKEDKPKNNEGDAQTVETAV